MEIMIRAHCMSDGVDGKKLGEKSRYFKSGNVRQPTQDCNEDNHGFDGSNRLNLQRLRCSEVALRGRKRVKGRVEGTGEPNCLTGCF